MRFSKRFHLEVDPDQDDWFDPILERDTDLFVDPFLIFKEASGQWANCHRELIGHFNTCFSLIAEGNLNPASPAYQKALSLLAFTEPRELCLGYTQHGTGGAGSGSGFAAVVAEAIVAAIRRGVKDIRHFEELGILGEGIGADRISDMACTILKPTLIAYTVAIATRHKIETHRQQVRLGGLDKERLRWVHSFVNLPLNPYGNRPILLVPRRFLARLPKLNADDWWDDFQNHQLRTDMNYEVMRKVSKATIVAKAREHPDFVRTWVTEQEKEPAQPYDLTRDRLGRYGWEAATEAFALAHPLALVTPTTPDQFFGVIDLVIERFRWFVEEQGGWKLLWDLQTEKPEEAAQLLFYGIGRSYCEANNIVLDREVNFGRGPVDFKFSNGMVFRALLEIKKLSNSKFWNGLDAQLPSYLKSDAVRDGWLVAVRLTDSKTEQDRATDLRDRVRRASEMHGRALRSAMIDARPKKSASKLTTDEPG